MPPTYPTKFKGQTFRRYEKESPINIKSGIEYFPKHIVPMVQRILLMKTPKQIHTSKELDVIFQRLQKLKHEIRGHLSAWLSNFNL